MMRTGKRVYWAVLFALALTVALGVSGRADDDPPGRVGRINYLQGQVSFQPAGGGDGDWVTAVPNRPLTIGDRLWTDKDGRAELHVGSTAIRADHGTGISFLNLSDNSVQLQVSAGTIIVRLRHLDTDDSFEVDAPNLAFSLLRAGDYRIDVDPDQNRTVVTVWSGQGEVTGGGRSYKISPDQAATFTGTDSLDYDLADTHAVPPTEFDHWAADRDAREDHLTSSKYVSPEMTGAEDLDTYGAWRNVPDYGPMWVPAGVAVGWAPYRFGHWAWIAPWGWTWVEDEPWGFAPFHYGRWAFAGGVWGWMPGPVGVGVVIARPVYAPALVAWVGGAPGFHFSLTIGGGGGVAWVPLGPREVFVPAYHVSDNYVTRVNVTNTVVERTTVVNVYHNTNVTNVTYVNQHVGGAVTVVSHDTFVNARPVSRNVVAVPAGELAAAPVSRSVAVEPAHASIVGAGRPATALPPAAVMNRTAVVKRPPPPPAARFGAAASVSAVRPSNGPVQPNQPSQPSQPAQPNAGYRPPNRPAGQPGGNQPNEIQPGGNRPVVNAPAGNQPGANQPAVGGNRPSNNVPNQVGGNTQPQPQADNSRFRPAPAPRQPTPTEQQNDNAKQQQWQQQHQQVHQNDKPPKGAQGKSDDRPKR